ncbi:hypothetical protein Hypma_002000 [Hypsizygus marmoreus]|uniref:Uncharacterized protein n=1 Tax=Hypsizygus marmoreus TaxID=39966 RepID=A0A369JEB7_HYPMA|nr:hypothetical protein Hypma_002000 [Hypsizygus marmoreus]
MKGVQCSLLSVVQCSTPVPLISSIWPWNISNEVKKAYYGTECEYDVRSQHRRYRCPDSALNPDLFWFMLRPRTVLVDCGEGGCAGEGGGDVHHGAHSRRMRSVMFPVHIVFPMEPTPIRFELAPIPIVRRSPGSCSHFATDGYCGEMEFVGSRGECVLVSNPSPSPTPTPVPILLQNGSGPNRCTITRQPSTTTTLFFCCLLA